MLLQKLITKPIILTKSKQPPCGFAFLTGLQCRCTVLLSIHWIQLLHWIWVYCGCVSIINCKTSQSKIYLTAKTAGEAEEDMGTLSFQKRWMDFLSLIVCVCFSGVHKQDLRSGRWTSVSTWCRLLSREDIAGLTWTNTMSPLWAACRRRDSSAIYFKRDTGYQYSIKCFFFFAMSYMKTTENIIYCLCDSIWKTVPHKMYWEIFRVLFKLFFVLFQERGLSK